jgi:hypothetical protein
MGCNGKLLLALQSHDAVVNFIPHALVIQGPTQVTTRQRSTAHVGSRQLCGEAALYPTFVISSHKGSRGGLHVGVTVHLEMRYLAPSISLIMGLSGDSKAACQKRR